MAWLPFPQSLRGLTLEKIFLQVPRTDPKLSLRCDGVTLKEANPWKGSLVIHCRKEHHRLKKKNNEKKLSMVAKNEFFEVKM